MAAPWSRAINTTIRNYIKEQATNILRNRKLTALLDSRGRITMNWSGLAMDWKVEYNRVKLIPFAAGDNTQFDQKDRYKTAVLEWRGYQTSDSIGKHEFLMNRNKEAIIRTFADLGKKLVRDMQDAFGEEFYNDGSLAQNAKRMHGINSFMQATANPGNGAGTPTGSFAGLSCVPGAYGGNWDPGNLPDWPNGRGDVKFDFFAPIIVDYGDTYFPGDQNAGTPTNTWAVNGVEAISFGLVKSQKSKSEKGKLDIIMIDDEMWRQYKTAYRTKERIVIERQANNSPLVALGFTDVINQDGSDITTEYGIDPGSGYGFNVEEMEVRSMQAELFVPEGPEYDISTSSWRVRADMIGNTTWNPKFQVAFKQLTPVGG